MTGVSPEDRQVKIETVGKWQIRITSYKLGDEFICTVDNVDPGATIARGSGSSRNEAESKARDTAKASLPR